MLNPLTPFLSGFEIVRPAHEGKQEELLTWLARAHAAAEANPQFEKKVNSYLKRFGCGPERIASRGSELDDAQSCDFTKGIYRVRGAGMLERTEFFSKAVASVFERMYPQGHSAPDHLIHVTCTGYVSPSPAQTLVERRGWSGRTDVTHAYHMGCYASIPAIRMARGFVAAGNSRVDIVHTELCTLHLNALDHSPEQLVVQSLFADGHIKYSVSGADPRHERGFEVVKCLEWIIPGTSDLMTWIPAEWGMKMTLSRDVPERISSSVIPFVERLLKQAGLPGRDTIPEMGFAIHPGGPRIIDSLAKLLGLRFDQTKHSSEVLRDYGNMSSATLPHIWKKMLDDDDVPSGRIIVSLAFGPGLTIFGAVLRKT